MLGVREKRMRGPAMNSKEVRIELASSHKFLGVVIDDELP